MPTQLGAHEIIILNSVKQKEYVASSDPIDESDKFDIIVSKWKNISTIMMNISVGNTAKTISKHVKI